MFQSLAAGLAQAQVPRRPNILLILADDLCHSDSGCLGGEIETRYGRRALHAALQQCPLLSVAGVAADRAASAQRRLGWQHGEWPSPSQGQRELYDIEADRTNRTILLPGISTA